MTKTFEEVLNSLIYNGVAPVTNEKFYLKSTLLRFFSNWHSDEEYQAIEKENKALETSNLKLIAEGTGLLSDNATLTKKVEDLKSQAKHQPLPVVPEFVAEWYEGCAPIPVETCITDFLFNYQKEKSVDDGTEFEQWFIRTDNSIEILMDMKRLGYQVKKPQLFYLKNKLTTSYLALDINTGYYEHWGEEIIPKLLNKQGYKTKFTQQEIASMQTGSYEKIEVAE